MKWNHQRQFLEDQIGNITRASGIPAALEEEPVVWAHLDLIYEAFWVMNLERPVGFGLGFIPLTSILAYLDLLGILGQADRLYWFKMFRALDVEYLSIHADERKKK